MNDTGLAFPINILVNLCLSALRTSSAIKTHPHETGEMNTGSKTVDIFVLRRYL